MRDENDEVIWNDGYEAYAVSSEDRDRNPHKKSTIAYGLWDEGWLQAMDDEYRSHEF